MPPLFPRSTFLSQYTPERLRLLRYRGCIDHSCPGPANGQRVQSQPTAPRRTRRPVFCRRRARRRFGHTPGYEAWNTP